MGYHQVLWCERYAVLWEGDTVSTLEGYHQYCGGISSVLWEGGYHQYCGGIPSSDVEDVQYYWEILSEDWWVFSTVEGYHQYCGEYSVLWSILSVLLGILSVLWTIVSTGEDTISTVWHTIHYCERYSVLWKIFSTVKDIQYSRGRPLALSKNELLSWYFTYYTLDTCKFDQGKFH